MTVIELPDKDGVPELGVSDMTSICKLPDCSARTENSCSWTFSGTLMADSRSDTAVPPIMVVVAPFTSSIRKCTVVSAPVGASKDSVAVKAAPACTWSGVDSCTATGVAFAPGNSTAPKQQEAAKMASRWELAMSKMRMIALADMGGGGVRLRGERSLLNAFLLSWKWGPFWLR